jgi:hypothetical protein
MPVPSCLPVCRSDRLAEPPDGDPEGVTGSEQSSSGNVRSPVSTPDARQLADPTPGRVS